MSYLKTFLPYLFGNKKGKSFKLPESLDFGSLKFEERLMFHALERTLDSFVSSLSLSELSSNEIFHLFSFNEYLAPGIYSNLKDHFPSEYRLFSEATTKEVLSVQALQEILNCKNNQLSIFALFKKDRSLPGRLLIRKADGSFVHKKNGDLWSVRVLGLSGRGLAFNYSNGATPCGVYSVDSVMPETNKTYEFGKFRRLIVNFLPASKDEAKIKELLPSSQHARFWWKECVLARELGRSLLRIHGTGTINKNPLTPYFPMIPSSGCLTTTERSFMGLFHINHQRELLDQLMEALSLDKSYENELKIHGLLYVIDFDGTYQALEFKS